MNRDGGFFFDVGGVLGVSAVSFVVGELERQGESVARDRLRGLMVDDRVLAGPRGTLESLLGTECCDVGVAYADIIDVLRRLPRYEENFGVALTLKQGGLKVGVLSDQFAESADLLREGGGFEVFDYVVFSSGVGLMKRTRHIFDKARELVGVSAARACELLMIDDHDAVLRVVSDAGWCVFLCTDYWELWRGLYALGVG